MIGLVVDCKTGKAQMLDDGLPQIKVTPLVLPPGLDREKVAETIARVDDIDRRLKDLEASHVL